MRLFERRKRQSNKCPGDYDRVNTVPVLRASICNGEQVAGFKDLHTGRFSEVMAIRGEKDLQAFLKQYGITESEIRKEW